MTTTQSPPTGTGSTRRASRYAIEAPARLRVGAGEWLAGTTVNIAHLGMLVRTGSGAPPVSSKVDVRLMLCTTERARTCSVVACSGRVVRVEPDGAGATAVAVTIDEYEMRPTPPAPSGHDDGPAEPW